MKDIRNDFKEIYTGKIKLAIQNNFIYSKDNNEEPVMHSKSDNIEIRINGKADKKL